MRSSLAVAALVVLLDQASKWAIVHLVLQSRRTIEVTGFFNLTLVYNTGVSFGLLGGPAPWKPWVLSGVALVIVIVLLAWLRKQGGTLLLLAGGLVAGGAIGNVIDRLRLSAVIDFLDFHVAGWHWPAFNVADSAIFIGVVLLVLDGLFPGGERSKEKDSDGHRGGSAP
jgi:signal peptidase II